MAASSAPMRVEQTEGEEQPDKAPFRHPQGLQPGQGESSFAAMSSSPASASHIPHSTQQEEPGEGDEPGNVLIGEPHPEPPAQKPTPLAQQPAVIVPLENLLPTLQPGAPQLNADELMAAASRKKPLLSPLQRFAQGTLAICQILLSMLTSLATWVTSIQLLAPVSVFMFVPIYGWAIAAFVGLCVLAYQAHNNRLNNVASFFYALTGIGAIHLAIKYCLEKPAAIAAGNDVHASPSPSSLGPSQALAPAVGPKSGVIPTPSHPEGKFFFPPLLIEGVPDKAAAQIADMLDPDSRQLTAEHEAGLHSPALVKAATAPSTPSSKGTPSHIGLYGSSGISTPCPEPDAPSLAPIIHSPTTPP